MDRWVIMNTKKTATLEEAVIWFGSDCTIIQGLRKSERGALKPVYILGGTAHYGNVGDKVGYVTDTGRGYGGKGTIHIENEMNVTGNILIGNPIYSKIQKREIWVFK